MFINIQHKVPVVAFHKHLFVSLCYVTPSDSSREVFIETSVFDRISDHIIEISAETNNNYHLLICGDLNSRTGIEPDYVVYDKPDNIPVLPENYVSDTAFDRFSRDYFINTNGRKLLDFCKLNSLRICNGRLGKDKGVGKYTYVGGPGSSVVDYVLVSESIINLISKFNIGGRNILSDHCAVYFSMSNVKLEVHPNVNMMQPSERADKKYIWNSDESQIYSDSIESYKEEFSDLQAGVRQASSGGDINENVDQFSDLMDKICDPFFAKNNRCDDGKSFTFNSRVKVQPWFVKL